MAYIMMMWGKYAFGINNAAFQQLERQNGWRWAQQNLYGQAPKLQFVGEEALTISLPGTIYPEWRGGTGQLDDMRAIADTAEPQTLIDGRGNILGLYVAESLSETQSVFGGFGIPRKQEFVLSLKRFPDPLIGGNVGVNALTKLAKSAGIDISAIKDAIQKAQSAIGQIKQAIAQAQLVAQSVQATIGAPFAAIDAAAKLAQNTAQDFKTVAQNANNLIKAPATTAANAVANANAAAALVVEATPTLTAQARTQSDSLKTSLQTVIDNGVPPNGVIATRAVMVSCNQQTAFLSRTYHSARTLRIAT